MILAVAALAAALLGQAAAPPSGGPDLFPDWRTLCVQHRGDIAAPIAQADGLGWQVAPPDMMKALPAPLHDAQGRYMLDGSGVEFVLTGRGDFPVGGKPVKASVCMVGARRVNPTELIIKAGALAGVAASRSGGDQTLFAYNETSAGHTALNVQDDAAVLSAVKAGAATVVLVQTFEGGALLAYAVPSL